jgi:hypothetical protein
VGELSGASRQVDIPHSSSHIGEGGNVLFLFCLVTLTAPDAGVLCNQVERMLEQNPVFSAHFIGVHAGGGCMMEMVGRRLLQRIQISNAAVPIKLTP